MHLMVTFWYAFYMFISVVIVPNTSYSNTCNTQNEWNHIIVLIKAKGTGFVDFSDQEFEHQGTKGPIKIELPLQHLRGQEVGVDRLEVSYPSGLQLIWRLDGLNTGIDIHIHISARAGAGCLSPQARQRYDEAEISCTATKKVLFINTTILNDINIQCEKEVRDDSFYCSVKTLDKFWKFKKWF